MKLSHLYEAVDSATIIKASRMLKFSTRNGENSFGVDFKTLKCEYFVTGRIAYIGKPGSLKEGEKYLFENPEKPGFASDRNSKQWNNGFKVTKILKTYDEFLKWYKETDHAVAVVDPALLKGSTPKAAAPKGEPTDPADGFFLLGFWGNPYGKNNEYFWTGPYKDRKNALAVGKHKQDHGQPNNFTNWVKGENKVIQGVEKFKIAAKRVGLNPKLDAELEWRYED